jgi:hypothetical protein
MLVDLDTVMLFGNFDNVLAAMQYRDFTARDPKAVTEDLQGVEKYLTNHTFQEQLQRLTNPNEENHPLAESLDKDLRWACISAPLIVKKCAKLRGLQKLSKPATW